MSLTIRQMIAQCIMPRISANEYYDSAEVRHAAWELVSEHGIGGWCVFQGDAIATARMIKELQQRSAIPLLISADFEFGLAMRLQGGTSFPHAMALGRLDDVKATFAVAQAIAKEARALGIHWNFAPVCDINSDKLNPIINIRAFGETPEEVGKHGSAYIQGTQTEHVMACAKHFPGHGDTKADSHIELPTLPFDKTRLSALELLPFKQVISAGVQSVMVGHLAIPALDDSGRPASLSYKIMTELLREELGFQGVITTDALDMNAIINHYDNDTASVLAFAGGADVVLLPTSALGALSAIEQAVHNGTISEERVRASYQRVYAMKEWTGAISAENPARKINVEAIDVNIHAHQTLALETARRAGEWFGAYTDILPMSKYKQFAAFALVTEKDMDAAQSFFTYTAQLSEHDCDMAFVNADISEEQILEYQEGTQSADIIIFAIFVRANAYQGTIRLPERLEAIAPRLAQGKPTIAVLFGNPYIRETFPASAFLCMYSSSEGSLAGAAFHLFKSDEMSS
jgi:beta-N-acetylhexosaminidase